MTEAEEEIEIRKNQPILGPKLEDITFRQRSQPWRIFAIWAIFRVMLAMKFLPKSPAKFGRFLAIWQKLTFFE